MKYNQLGNSGLLVSELCFGSMTFGGQGYWEKIGVLAFDTAKRLVDNAIENGINYFDTADIYSYGKSEEILGKALADKKRDSLVIATKVRGRMSHEINDVGLSRQHIIKSCEDSLRRLKTDYIDHYIVHRFDPLTPLEETLRTLDDLVRQGKVRYLGCSNFYAWQLMKALAISEKQNLERFITLQALYSLISRDVETELIPLLDDQGMSITPWSPLGGGFLSGKYKKGDRSSEGRRNREDQNFIQIDENKGYAILDKVLEIAQMHNTSASQIALSYLLHKKSVASVIIGCNNESHLADNLKAVEVKLTLEEMGILDSVSAPARVYPKWMLDLNAEERISGSAFVLPVSK
ncbi:MAG: aldo/keto reductase [Bacteroidota bacterium]